MSEETISELRAIADRWKANHRDAVQTKRGIDKRLRVALAGLQKIYDMSNDGTPFGNAIREVAGEAFERATHDVPRRLWDKVEAAPLTQGQQK